jgi:hypothetical protein
MVGEIGALVLGFLVDLAAALLQLVLRLIGWASSPVRFACSKQYRAQWRERFLDQPVHHWLRLAGGCVALSLLLLLAVWGLSLVTAERETVHVDRIARTETVLGNWALGAMRRVYHERVAAPAP